MRITIARAGSPLWQACGDLARERYAIDYGAAIDPAPDAFVALCDDESAPGVPQACAGFTYGGSSGLLIDNYLGEPAATAMSHRLGRPVPPSGLIEVGPLVSRTAGAGMLLIPMVPALCWCNGGEFLMATVTRKLAVVLKRVGLRFVPMAVAREDALPASQRGRWGSYYQSGPVAGYIDLRLYEAQLRIVPDADPHLAVIWPTGDLPAGADLAGVR